MDPSSEVLVDYPPVFRIYKDRRIDRLIADDSVPAGLDTATGVTSKDVTIDGDAGVYVCLYLPAMASPDDGRKLPVVVYYHGGGFVAMSAASWIYQGFLNSLAARAGVLVVSVNYRLAPEHPFPVGYEDSLRALEWAVAPGSDPWLSRHGDLGRLFLAGDSAGGNIVHNVAMTPAAAQRMKIEGVVLLHPAFWGREPIAGETPEAAALMENLWGVVCPEAATTGDGTDDPRMNPLAAAAPSLRGLPCRRLLVCTADGDFLRQRGKAYYEGVAASGWGGAVEWFESKDAVHCFFFHEPECGEAVALMDRLVDFINGEAENA
ncbi:hypothetical protein ACP70R_003887 [Stipagrostis hirtigluma subsp. patula]